MALLLGTVLLLFLLLTSAPALSAAAASEPRDIYRQAAAALDTIQVFACPHPSAPGPGGTPPALGSGAGGRSRARGTGLSPDQPLASLHEAQSLARSMLAGRASPATVRVRLCRGRTHALSESLRFTHEDNPHGQHSVTWSSYEPLDPGSYEAAATISGGLNVTAWAAMPKGPPGLWQAPAPPGLSFARQLWVDNKRQGRPSALGVNGSCGTAEDFTGCSVLRLPDGTAVALTQQWQNDTLPDGARCPSAMGPSHQHCVPTGYVVNSTAPLTWANPQDVELTFTRCGTEWTEARCTIANITAHGPAGSLITMSTPCFGQVALARFGKTIPLMPRRIENVLNRHDSWAQALRPGEFYFDRQLKTIYLATSASVAAAAPAAVTVIGNAESLIEGAANMTSITFDSINFELGGGWQGVNTPHGLPQYQAGYRSIARLPNAYPVPGSCPIWGQPAGNCWTNLRPIPAAISFPAGKNIRFKSCSFRRIGAAALWFGTGSRNCSVSSCTFDDISGSAVMIGGIDDAGQPDRSLWTAGNSLENSTLTNLALEYHGSAGVLVGWSADTRISHNEIANMSYTGISNGWGWGDRSYSNNNTIVGNHIHHVMCGAAAGLAPDEQLVDGGALYSLGAQPGSSRQYNYLHHQCRHYGMICKYDGHPAHAIPLNFHSELCLTS